ncbi:MAG: phosphoribosyltransferase [Prevotellaceae bacterium]|jgi:xanthine phosphoribosyltransferase|nr:phosphoribosyltransferase [Prevotellaceae bacterium]
MVKTMDEVMERFRSIDFPEEFDLIVAIAHGGIIPAAILNQRLQMEVRPLYINLRDEQQQPRYPLPRLLAPVDFDYCDRSILLVDDRVKTGATFFLALHLLQGARLIRTFAVNGSADYSLYDEECFRMPWLM